SLLGHLLLLLIGRAGLGGGGVGTAGGRRASLWSAIRLARCWRRAAVRLVAGRRTFSLPVARLGLIALAAVAV
ncbi:MAG: hypothetical protein GTO53_11440, partial [Planctomycetales bacterium]|nr:hypothetical protein [Planctomycetales bacterium]NIM09727.1 hypothetical protein [Planctomycetales bacterium]NIN09202.1 hypothetical protein [Planctomycetales bacterium]NIN78299.1 hypothetical protein [Planctomycetales bacterium]NIO35483.1 hypothetical protein [Planctomycetales bacterium]